MSDAGDALPRTPEPPPAPRVSVIVPAYNAEPFIGACLESIEAQRGDFELEIVVVDDGSTDNTRAAASRNASVQVLHQTNRGPAAARNRGIEATTGELVAFIDADDLWPAGSLAARLDVLRTHPDAALACGDCRQFDRHAAWPRTLFETGGWGFAAWGQRGTVPNAYQRLLDDNFITTGTVMVRRRVLEDEGGFSEDLRLVEDLELWLRIARQYPIAWSPSVCLLRRRHQDNISSDAVSMSHAFLEVLRRQPVMQDRRSAAVSPQLERLMAQEYMRLSDLALSQRQGRASIEWAWRSARKLPTARAWLRVARAVALAMAGVVAGAAGNRTR